MNLYYCCNNIEITFWEDKRNLITDQNAVGKILAVSSTIVTFFRELQLESTSATAVSINPPIPDLQQYINRFKEIGEEPTTFHSQPIITLAQMMQKNPDSITQNKGACNVTLADFDHDKPLAYVNCNNCNQRAHLHEKSKFVCLDHWDDYGVKCMYCVNTIIKDKDTTAKAIFFDEAMTDMLETTCEEMIMKRGYKDTKLIPDEIIALQGQHCQLQMTIKKDKSIAVNRAKNLFRIHQHLQKQRE
ncbi:uncharacterized protein LOC143618529 [Bidens hawaiensis]|uniref:uncharacterized protein LOC143618529 n=1 Tax=Bidens hawaiensis TaxID=980011 RepID=UPI00404BA2A9